MTDVDAITEGIPSSSDIGDCTRQEENDLEIGTTKQSLTPHENESSLNRGSTGESGSEDQQADPDMINPWSKCDSLSRNSELGPNGDLDAEVAVPTRTTGTDSLIGMETDTNVVNDQAGVRGEQSTASTEPTGYSETLIETFNHQQPISPPASKIRITPEEENFAKVGNPKTADSEDEKACTMSPEQGEISQSNHGVDYSPDSAARPYSTDAAVPPEDPNPSPRFQVEHKLTNADHLQSVVPNNGEPLEDRILGSQVHSTEDVGRSKSSQCARGDSGVDNSSECVPPSIPTVAVEVAPAKPGSFSRRAWMEKVLTNADNLQPASTNNAKPVQYLGQTEDVGNNHSSQGARGDLRVDDSSVSAPPLNPPVAAAVAPAKHATSSTRGEDFSNAVHLQPAGTYDNAKPLEHKGQTEDAGNNHSSHGAQGDSGVGDSSESAPPLNPPVAAAVAPAKHATSSTRGEDFSNAVHLQPAGTYDNAKPLEHKGHTEDAGNNHSSHGAQGDSGVGDSSESVPLIFSVPHKSTNPSRGPQAEQKPTNAYRYHPEDQGQGLQQGYRRGVGHMTSSHSMQGDFTRIPSKSMSTSPQNFQQHFAGATSGVYQINQDGYLRTSLCEHVQPQRPHLGTKVSKLGPYDGGRQVVPITQHQPQDPKPTNKEAQLSQWHRLCYTAWRNNEELEREVESYKTQLWKMEQKIQDLTSKLEQAQENTVLLNKQISKYEQQHAQEIHTSGSYLDDSKAATPALLVSALNGVKDASNNFAKAFKAQVDSSPSTMQASVKQHLSKHIGQVSRNGHIKFQYQAFVCQHLFEGFDHRNFGVFESTPGFPVTTVEHSFRQYQMHDFKKSDTVERLFRRDLEIDNFLHEYCFKKFSLIFNRQLEEQLFDGKCEQNDSIDKYEHPCNSRFYRSYCKLAVSIWLVHRLAFSFNQPAKLFCPPPGMPFNTSNMQSVVPLDPASDDEEVQLKVGFCVIPGMKVGESIVPSEVYVFGQ